MSLRGSVIPWHTPTKISMVHSLRTSLRFTSMELKPALQCSPSPNDKGSLGDKKRSWSFSSQLSS